MCFRFALTIIIFIGASFPLAADDESGNRHIITFKSIEELFSTPMQLNYSDGGRNWSDEDLSTYRVRSSFDDWIRCFRNTSPECEVCNLNDPLPNTLVNITRNNCLPPPSEERLVFSEHLLPSQKQKRDEKICRCFLDGDAAPLENYSFSLGVRTRAARGSLWEREKIFRENATEERVVGRLMTERFAFGFSAASFIDNSRDALELAARYSARGSAIGDSAEAASSMVNKSTSNTQRDIPKNSSTDNPSSNTAIQSAEREALNSHLFNGTNLPEGYCLPYRTFLASKQFPIAAKFYEDLDSQSEQNFNPADWDYMVLIDELKAKSEPYGGLYQALNQDDSVKRLHARIRFLYNNPVMKNIFLSAGNLEMKKELFRKIKAMPRPNCGPDACTRDERWSAATNRYRTDLAEFLSRQNVIAAGRDGSKISRELTLFLAEDEARMIASSADKLIPEDKYLDASEWAAFCDARRFDLSARSTGSTAFLQGLLEGLGNRDFKDYTQDSEYGLANADVCTSPRKNAKGEELTFNKYFEKICSEESESEDCKEENRLKLVSRFLKDYPQGRYSPTVESLIPFIDEKISLGVAGKSEIERFNQVASRPDLAREPVRFSGERYSSFNSSRGGIRELTSSEMAIVRAEGNISELNESSVNAKISPPSSSSTATSQNPQGLQQLNPFAQAQGAEWPIFAPLTPAKVNQEEQTAEVVRTKLADGESQTREIREEISSIQKLLKKESTSQSPDSNVIAGLNQRLSDWERRFRDQQQENVRLKDQLDELERSSRRGQVAQNQGDSQNTNSRRPASSANEAKEAVTYIPQGVSAGGMVNGPVSTGGSMRGGGSNDTGGATPASQASVLAQAKTETGGLGRFGIQNFTVRNGITVAEASGTIDYQKLRTESANSVLPITVTVDEFNQFSQNVEAAIARYVDRVRAMPGSVVRVNLQSGRNQEMEFFVVKDGEQISVVQAPGSVARTPASIQEVQREREFTLQGLQNELSR